MGITEQSQNKLLKELEDNGNFFLIATVVEEEGSILPTIFSRVVKEHVGKESREEFYSHFSGKEEEEISLLYHMSDGYILLAEEMSSQAPIYQKVREAILKLNKKGLLSALSLVADKDSGNYFEMYREYLQQLFSFMAAVVMQNYTQYNDISVLETINHEKGKALSKWYGKADFFTSITKIAECLSKFELKKEDDYE